MICKKNVKEAEAIAEVDEIVDRLGLLYVFLALVFLVGLLLQLEHLKIQKLDCFEPECLFLSWESRNQN